MSKKKLTYSLNYRRPKSEYKPSDELMICIRYYHKCENTQKTKIIKKSTGVKCKLKDWNSDWHKSSDRTPIKYTDPHHKKKNKILKDKVKTFDIDDLFNSVKNDSLSDYLKSKLPHGPLEKKWTNHKNSINLVSPANKRNIDVIVVGTGLAGGSACATLAELGYNVKAFCFQDSPRRAHSIAAQGGINAAKNYQGDGDSIYRLFYDTVKGGDYRSREENVYRLAEVSANIIDQCVAQGVPFARFQNQFFY